MKWSYIYKFVVGALPIALMRPIFLYACVCGQAKHTHTHGDILIMLNGEYFMSDDDEIERSIDRIRKRAEEGVWREDRWRILSI